jgi:hypothetical protein
MNSFASAMVLAEFASNNFLDEIARKQWQADLSGGDYATRQLKETDRLLSVIKTDRKDQRYIDAYNKAQRDVM